MILYFADRQLNILGQASTNLPKGLTIIDDLKTEDTSIGSVIFECTIPFDANTRQDVANFTEVGNYILRDHEKSTEFYTIIETETDTKKQEVYIYAEDAGMDLLNEVVGTYEADIAYPISHYIEMFMVGSGFQIGINEVESMTKQLSWDGEQTQLERLLSIAEAFENCEIGFSFGVDGLVVTAKYINIYAKRGQELGIQLRLNKEVASITTTKSIANLATALLCVGGTPDDADEPITLLGYEYDDGDIYINNKSLVSRTAVEKWGRLLWKDDGSQEIGGHITKQFSYDTLSQKELCEQGVAELQKVCDIDVNYEADIKELPENVQLGDRVNIVDDAGELYLSTRLLTIETSVANNSRRAVLGEYLIKNSGISEKVEGLAAKFAASAAETAKALAAAQEASASVTTIAESSGLANATANEATERVATAESELQELAESIATLTIAKDDVYEKLDVATQTIDILQDGVATTEGALTELQETVDTLGEKTDYIQVGTYNNQPCIELGEKDNEFKLRITNTEIQFADGTTIPAYVSNQKLMIEKAEVTHELQFGGFAWQIRSNGNMSLVWKGVDA